VNKVRATDDERKLYGPDIEVAKRADDCTVTVKTATTLVGFNNIMEPGDMLKEWRRIVSGSLLSISQFYPDDDLVNGKLLKEYGLDIMSHRESTVEAFLRAGWTVNIANSMSGKASPTPKGLDGQYVIDGMPITDTVLEWCTIIAK
jgi:hypothetical protein